MNDRTAHFLLLDQLLLMIRPVENMKADEGHKMIISIKPFAIRPQENQDVSLLMSEILTVIMILKLNDNGVLI